MMGWVAPVVSQHKDTYVCTHENSTAKDTGTSVRDQIMETSLNQSK